MGHLRARWVARGSASRRRHRRAETLRIGLVNRVVPADQLEPETLKLAERLAQ
jgi:enoyl-CoA hydratase/carnithine racemase